MGEPRVAGESLYKDFHPSLSSAVRLFMPWAFGGEGKAFVDRSIPTHQVRYKYTAYKYMDGVILGLFAGTGVYSTHLHG
jgi:hypothetical protein